MIKGLIVYSKVWLTLNAYGVPDFEEYNYLVNQETLGTPYYYAIIGLF